MNSHQRAIILARAIDEWKAEQIVVLDVSKSAGWCDFFVICSGYTRIQAKAIVERALERMRSIGERHLQTEGYQDSGWILADWGDVVLHVFVDEMRQYYGLERLWGDAPQINWTEQGEHNNG